MGLFSFLGKNKQDADSDAEAPVKVRRARRGQASESQEPVDPVLPEKKRARRRLIGATALVLAAIIGLPMIFDSEPKPLAGDIAIQIPSRDKPLPEVVAETPPVAALPPAAAPEPVAVEKKSEPAPAAAPLAVIKPEPKTEAKPEVPVAIASATPAKEKSSRFIVQVAAVATQVRATDLQARLNKAGIKSYSQKDATNAGERIRIRVGPFASKEEAEKMRVRLVKLGLSGSLLPA